MRCSGSNPGIFHALRVLTLGLGAHFLVACQGVDSRQHVMVSASDQKMVLLDQGEVVKTYPISTSKYGLGDTKNSYRTPIGKMVIARKIGDNIPKGAVFKSRQWTGEVLPADAPGRDPILTRILWLKGRENCNKNAYSRLIYIHGTTEERFIGKPVSYGCVRMKSDDVLDLYQRVRVGTPVTVYAERMPMAVRTAELRHNMKHGWSNNGQALAQRNPELTPEKVVPQADPLPVGSRPGLGEKPAAGEAAPTVATRRKSNPV